MRLDLPGDGPDEAREFARQCRDHHRRFLATGAAELFIAVVQAPLRFPRCLGHMLGQTFLAFLQMRRQSRRRAVMVRRLHQRAAREVIHLPRSDAALASY